VTSDANTRSRSAHEHAWQLLPWFVTGRLSSDDAQRVERHLETCEACRIELDAQRELATAFRQDDSVMLAPQSGLQKMLARIDASMPESVATDSETAVIHSRKRTRWAAIAATLSACAIGSLLTLGWQQLDARLHAPQFETLTTSPAGAARGATLRLVVRPDTRVDDLQRLVRSIDAQIVAGPSEAGVYTLEFSDDIAERHVAETLLRIRREQAVVFAERVSPEPPR
jgi:hypothetical protein